MKSCSKCLEDKPIELFYRNKNNPDGRAFECKACSQKRDKARYATDERRISKRNSEFQRYYGISAEDASQMYEEQSGKCAICDTDMEFFSDADNRRKSFCVDHNHSTGKVRGLLCSDCNRGIGLLKDNADVLEAAAKYLRISNGS